MNDPFDPVLQFNAWLSTLDTCVIAIAGVGVHDLPDRDFWSLFDEYGDDPEACARQILEDEGFPEDTDGH